MRQLLQNNKPFVLEADRIEYDDAQKTYRADGNVVLKQDQAVLRGEHVTYDAGRNVVTADGNVSFKTPDGEFWSDGMELQVDSQTAVLARGTFVVKKPAATYYLRGRRVEKVAADRYLIQGGSYSTCDCGPDDADWFVSADYIDVTFDGYAYVERGRIYLRGQPVFYLPIGVFPAVVSRTTGFLPPLIGNTSFNGFTVDAPYYWNISPSDDATFDPTYMARRGTKLGLQYRYENDKRFYGEFDGDVIKDAEYGNAVRYTVNLTQQFNPTGKLYFRDQIRLVSDRDYVNDFPRDVTGRYDRYLRSDVIANNLWTDYDLNVDAEHWTALAPGDNSFTWQRYPHAQFDAVSQQFGPIPLYGNFQAVFDNFYRQKAAPADKAADLLAGNAQPYLYLTQGQRALITPELHAPLNFDQYATITPYATGQGAFYELARRADDRNPDRFYGELGANAFTRFEQTFPVSFLGLRGLKHQFEPDIGYRWGRDPDNGTPPIFDPIDRVPEASQATYGLTQRLWMRLYDPAQQSLQTFKLLDFRILHGYDLTEADKKLETPGEKREPWMPVRVEFETDAPLGGGFLKQAVVRTDGDYQEYLGKISAYDVLGMINRVNGDFLSAEYRFHRDQFGVEDIDYISGSGRYTPVDFISFDALANYSFINRYFIETRYAVELHSIQRCLDMTVTYDKRSIPRGESALFINFNFTGLIAAQATF